MRRATVGLRHLSLKTNALDKTVRFYTEILGLEVAFRVTPRRCSSAGLVKMTFWTLFPQEQKSNQLKVWIILVSGFRRLVSRRSKRNSN